LGVKANKDLFRLKNAGIFREDLFYRINVASIRIPPLRERPSDILPLTRYFVGRYNGEFHKNVRNISREVEEFLTGYDWPGNVRELKNVVEAALILIDEDTLLLEHLPAEILGQAPRFWKTTEEIQIPPEGISLEKVEEALVKQALKMTKGNQTKAAKLLDISRDALRYRLQKLGDL
jgi:transcriptional regulator with PAS, ATPase and Fis domain